MNSVQLIGRLTRDPEIRYTEEVHFCIRCGARMESDNE